MAVGHSGRSWTRVDGGAIVDGRGPEYMAVVHSGRSWLVGWLSGGFTPCRHLRPSSGREHTIVTYSVR